MNIRLRKISYRLVSCIFFQEYSMYIKTYTPPHASFYTNTQFYTIDLIHLEDHSYEYIKICLFLFL